MKRIFLFILTGMFLCIKIVGAQTITKYRPVLEFSTYLGGSADDRAHGMAVDELGNVYLTAPIRSGDFPITENAIQRRATGVYMAKMNATGDSLLASTYIGTPGGANYAHGVAVDKEGCIYLAGNTTNAGFPTTRGAFDRTFNGPANRFHGDAFVMKLNPDGSEIIYSTFIGGSGMDICGTICVDSEGYAYVLGCTSSADFPVTPNAYDTVSHGQDAHGRDDIFVAKLNPSGSELLYCTYIGGSSTEIYSDNIIVDSYGCAYICGNTSSSDFPTTPNAFDTSYNGGSGYHGQGDAFLVKLNPAGTDLEYATFIGGSDDDGANNIALDNLGNIYLAGFTKSTDFPTTPDAFSQVHKGGEDAFFVKLDLLQNKLSYATLLGGSQNDRAKIGLHESGIIVLAGSTESDDFPVTENAYDLTHNGQRDIFVTILDPITRTLQYSTYFGGSGHEYGLLLLHSDNIYLAGNTTSTDFPVTAGAYDTTYNGGDQSMPWGGDVFITKLSIK